MSSTRLPARGPLHAVQVLGGTAGAQVRSLAEGLVARGVEVTVCAPPAAVAAYGLRGTGARLASVRGMARPGPRTDAAAVTALRFLCAQADVVHAHGTRTALLASVALAGVRRRPPLVVTWHGAVAEGVTGSLFQVLERRVARASTVVLGGSSDLVDRVRRLGARDARLAQAAFGAPRSEPAQPPAKVRAELGAVGRALVLAVGRLESHKGYELLLDAARGWRALDPAPLVLIAGEGGQRPLLQRRIDQEDLPVRLLGRRDDVPELLAAADVVVLPSRRESHPLIAQEALHAGVPLVATAVGGIPELVGDAAVLVPYGDPAALSRAVLGLLADPERRQRLVAAGHTQAATWPTEDDAVAQVLSVYDEVRATAAR